MFREPLHPLDVPKVRRVAESPAATPRKAGF